MKRNLKYFCLSSLLFTSPALMAQGNVFFGVDYLNFQPNASVTGTYNDGVVQTYTDGTENGSGVNYKLGYTSDSFRITFNGGERFSSDTTDYTSYGVNFDYLFPKVKTFDDEAMKPYIGLKYAMGTLDDQIAGDFDVNEYGVQAGLIFVNKSPYELELGVAYTMFDGDASFTNRSGTYKGSAFTAATGSLELDNALSFYVGLNYKF